MSENIARCPADYALTQGLYEDNGPIKDSLAAAVDPLGLRLSEYIASAVASLGNPVDAWPDPIGDRITNNLPFGEDVRLDPYRMLPPGLFDGNDDSELTLPIGYFDRRYLVDGYIERADEALKKTPRFVTERRSTHGDNVVSAIGALVTGGIKIDRDKWSDYSLAAKSQREVYDHIVSAGVHRDLNVGRMLRSPGRARLLDTAATGTFASYMYRATDFLHTKDGVDQGGLVGYIFTPVGAYGESFAEKLLQTTRYAVEAVPVACANIIPEAAAKYAGKLDIHTARGKEGSTINRTTAESLVTTMQEGTVSIMQTIALLTADKVPGYDDPVELIQAIAENGLVTQFTRLVPMGVVGPFTLAGRYFPQPIVARDGRLYLNPDMTAALKEAKAIQVGVASKEWQIYREDIERGYTLESPSSLGLMCPAAGPHGSVEALSEAMVLALAAIKPPRRFSRLFKLVPSALLSP